MARCFHARGFPHARSAVLSLPATRARAGLLLPLARRAGSWGGRPLLVRAGSWGSDPPWWARGHPPWGARAALVCRPLWWARGPHPSGGLVGLTLLVGSCLCLFGSQASLEANMLGKVLSCAGFFPRSQKLKIYPRCFSKCWTEINYVIAWVSSSRVRCADSRLDWWTSKLRGDV